MTTRMTTWRKPSLWKYIAPVHPWQQCSLPCFRQTTAARPVGPRTACVCGDHAGHLASQQDDLPGLDHPCRAHEPRSLLLTADSA